MVHPKESKKKLYNLNVRVRLVQLSFGPYKCVCVNFIKDAIFYAVSLYKLSASSSFLPPPNLYFSGNFCILSTSLRMVK